MPDINSLNIGDAVEGREYTATNVSLFCYNAAIDSPDSSRQFLPDPIFLTFMAELKQSFASHREAKWYSERVGCAYRTLCRVCESSAGRTPKELIDERVLTEARRPFPLRITPESHDPKNKSHQKEHFYMMFYHHG